MRILSIATVLILLVTGSAFAQDVTPNLDKGTKTIEITGRLDTDTPLDFSYNLGLGFGYFVMDNLEIGIGGRLKGNDLWNHYDLGLYGQYNIPTGSQWVPFVFLGGYYAGVEVDDDFFNVDEQADFDTGVGKVGAGIAVFLLDNLSLDARIVYNWAADDLWVNQDGETRDSNTEGLLGLRYYWQ